MKFSSNTQKAVTICCLLVALLGSVAGAQTRRPTAGKRTMTPKAAPTPANSPVVTQVDDAKLKELLRPKDGKPLLVNFWATWCDPCREEFPELVKIDADYKGRIDFITVTLDEPEEIKVAVPKFLSEMKAPMPAFLLVSADESSLIAAIAKDWTGALPF